ncbi:cytochrome P450 [Daedalea quercina L-15889]|uniref:Cytochrome P450 n=1 Tax=Daedalea quercina L-15889 TaxID=1314783 RepID=A0A165RD50_9APHY|nr:cytochrome P450 [Daedalea quercina L-15889]
MLWTLIGIVCAYLFMRWRSDPINRIPTVGPSLPLLSYVGAFRFVAHARKMLQEGYSKYNVFKVAIFDRWIVVVSGAKMNDELRRLPDEVMSFQDAANELVQPVYTVAPDASVNMIHIEAIREQLPRNLARLFPCVVEEVGLALDDLVPATQDEWLPVKAFPTVAQIISRASNRVFVGAPLCRDKEFLDLACKYTNDVMTGAGILMFFPNFLKPVVGRLLPWPRRAIRAARPYLKPIMDERHKQLSQSREGDEWPDKPNDLLMWMMEDAKRTGMGYPEDLLVQAVLAANFTAIHTSTITFAHALYHLAANPEYVQPLREEIESVIKEDGWTKVSTGRMWKLDSFLKESQRMNGVSGLSITRFALQDVTLSDGTFIPARTVVSGAMSCTHLDEDNYANAAAFDGFRFSRMREEDERERNKHHYVSTSAKDIGFGHGKHACPGRFFAANELKIMLACIVLRYDVKFREEGRRPENEWLATSCYPCRTAEVLFKRRDESHL